ncbi:hypothetical protein [Terriglobus tenax]|uniref:hypothetical protein n=1 Tax=Terriglobus tenax TaxID=1111115 RepID=UPI0021DFD2B7|nr:hypothetical protein [Terriglobus tenax]
MAALEHLLLRENFYWAWGKVRRYYTTTDAWYDELEVAQFEANLDVELDSIRKQFAKGTYTMAPLVPLPQPKAPDSEARPRARQAFWVRVRDQVAWVAFTNVIGPELEEQMPTWSYGNRLYRPVWYDTSDSSMSLRFGPFRNSGGLLYRRFQHSWPLYRRHIYLTVRRMGLKKYDAEVALNDAERAALEAEERRSNRLPYLQAGYWRTRTRNSYWVSLDLEKFYPSLLSSAVASNIRAYCKDASDITGSLLDDLLRFKVDYKNWSDKELMQIGLSSKDEHFSHVPTGLMVAGFLANVAMLKIDSIVNRKVADAQVAHFRYVDDHVVLAPTFEKLESWVRKYDQLLSKHAIGATFNPDKFDPKDFGNYYSLQRKKIDFEALAIQKRSATEASKLDPRFPTPLMTKTLAKISEIGRVDFDLLDSKEEDAALHDLEHLLLAPLPETELPAATRASFAATKIARLASNRQESKQQLVAKERELLSISDRIRATSERLKDRSVEVNLKRSLRQQLAADKALSSGISESLRSIRQWIDSQERKERARIFATLMKAVRDHPEKLRLWQRVLEYCRLTGHDQLVPIIDELNRQALKGTTGCRVLRARLLQTVAKQLLVSVRVLLSDEYPSRRRLAAKRYIGACFQLVEKLSPSQMPKFYERRSVLLCQAAAGIVRLEIQHASTDEVLSKTDIASISRAARRAEALNWSRVPAEWISESGYSLGTWAWWADTRIQPKLATKPGLLWQTVAPNLNPKEQSAWAMLSRYPAALAEFSRQSIPSSRMIPPSNPIGWLLESVSDHPQSINLYPRNSRFRQLITFVTKPKTNMISLSAWCEWTRARAEVQPFDPRTGEWTALKITLKLLSVTEHKRGAAPIHWSEFWIPAMWLEPTDSIPRWDTWNSALEKGTVISRHIPASLHPIGIDVPIVEKEFLDLQEFGLVLLGLLRRDFTLPAAWNMPGRESDSGEISRELIRQVAASSWTTAILEACLIPRQKENFLFDHKLLSGFGGDDDTAYDPPRIFTKRDLRHYLERATEVLEQGQITVHNHQPRQLIPLRLEQISREEWAIEQNRDEIPEDDDQ